jgi:hypothetical protein
MPLDTPHLVQCDGCDHYMPPESWVTIPEDWSNAARFDSAESALAAAKRRGWIAPDGELACPDCLDPTALTATDKETQR